MDIFRRDNMQMIRGFFRDRVLGAADRVSDPGKDVHLLAQP